jgi:hypothetical protein
VPYILNKGLNVQPISITRDICIWLECQHNDEQLYNEPLFFHQFNGTKEKVLSFTTLYGEGLFDTCGHDQLTKGKSYLIYGMWFLVHLNWKLKWAFLITRCPSSVRRPPDCKLLHFRLLLQNHWANFNQTWHKSSLGEVDSKLFKWRGFAFLKGR